jgi:threonine synthase
LPRTRPDLDLYHPRVHSTLTYLEGGLSGRRYPAHQLHSVDPDDERPLLARYDLQAAAATLTADAVAQRPRGLWRWRELLPVCDPQFVTDLGEGDTPLIAAPRLGTRMGLPRLQLKLESLNPTGSFKARGMAVAVARNRELGASAFVVPSAGNAGGALAAYAAAAGVPATVVMPVDAPDVNKAEAATCGAELVLVRGLISDCGRLAQRMASDNGIFNLATLAEPYRVEGKKTMGLELAEQTDWKLPDVVVYPTGGGTGLIGMWKAFAELEAIGLIGSRRPRLVTVQADGCAPIVRAFERGERFAEPWQNGTTAASGLRVPSALGDFLILDALRASGGTAIAVSEDSIDHARRDAGQLGAGYVSPETAAALAGAEELRHAGWIGRDEHVVVFDTGVGHKYEPPKLPAVNAFPVPASRAR